jgi:hypothetical protein
MPYNRYSVLLFARTKVSIIRTSVGSGAPSQSVFSLTGRLQEVGINHIDLERCTDPYDGFHTAI